MVGDLVLNEEKGICFEVSKIGLCILWGPDLSCSAFFFIDKNGYQVVHSLTEDDVKNNTFTIYDVVLPLPGYDMTYPSNKIFDFYKETLENDGLDIYNMRRQQKELSLPGKYRYT